MAKFMMRAGTFGTHHLPPADVRNLGRARLVRVAALAVVSMLSSGCRSDVSDASALDVKGCVAEPPPAPPGERERGPFPFETCRPALPEGHFSARVVLLDQEATAARRASAPRACCYAAAR